jgi:2-dehydro-3-deoxyphosphogluconate aldolase/(4S)-4-hydroxy-2-oxoglutarate aldolase
MILDRIKELPVIGILRGIKEAQIVPVAEIISRSGLKCAEITMNTDDAGILIKKMAVVADSNLIIGAGTVVNMHDLNLALDAGAQFIVMPSIVEEVIEYCVLNKIPVFPGALTPTEIYKAWKMGAAMVKVFPAGVFGPKYFRDIKAPFGEIELMATGGVSADNITEFFEMGASGAAFGASIFKKEWLENKEYDKIEKGIKAIIENYTNWKMSF